MSEAAAGDAALRAALLRVVRAFAAEADPAAVMRALLAEAVGLVGADDGGLCRWDPDTRELRTAFAYQGEPADGELLDPATSASGRAAVELRPVVIHDYQRTIGPTTPAGRSGAQAVAAVPVRHEDQLLGVLSVSSYRPGHRFRPAELEVMELLAGVAAATLVGLERSRLRGALLAADTAAAALRDQLGLATGYASMLAATPELPTGAREHAERVVAAAESAAALLDRLRRLTRLEERPARVGVPPTLDLERSTEPPDRGSR